MNSSVTHVRATWMAVLWAMIALVGLGVIASAQAANEVSVTFGTWYYYTTMVETSIANVPLVAEKVDSGFFGTNSIDLTGAAIVQPMYVYRAALPARANGKLLAPGDVFTWTPPDIPEGDTVWANARTQEEATFSPGFRVEYTLTPEQVTAPGGKQTVTLIIVVEEAGLAGIEFDIAVARETPHATATIRPFLAPRSPWISPEGDRLYWGFSEPRVGQRFYVSATIDVQLKEGVPFARYKPTIGVWTSKNRAEGRVVGADRVERTLPEGTWTWSGEGIYTWNWVDQIRRAVIFQGFAAPGFLPPTAAAIGAAVDRGLDWLASNQNPDGSWDYGTAWQRDRGITATAAWAFLQAGYSEDVPTVRRALDFVLAHQREDGSFDGSTYKTSLAIIALVATGNPAYCEAINQAVGWLKEAQHREDKDYAEYGHPGLSCPDGETCWAYGGWGYDLAGTSTYQRDVPYIWSDNSNTQFAVAALAAAGFPSGDPVWKRVLDWVTRCQNVDGGFTYQPGGNSYGSMTAAGVWELGVMGIHADDPRVEGGLEWLRRNYAYWENPRSPEIWHYYYLWSAARALLHYDFPGTITPAAPLAGWYYDFAGYLVHYQEADGSWVGAHRRDNGSLSEPPEYATALAILVLSRAAVPTLRCP